MNSERATGPPSRQDLERPISADSPVVADREPADEALPTGNGAAPNGDFATLRQLLIGPEQRRLGELAARLDEMHLTPTELAELLPEAIALRASRDRALGRALAPTVETALHESVRRNPREVAAAIFPVLGPAIRKAIAETMGALVRSINSAVESSLSTQGLKWRVEAWRTGVPYAQVVIKHALVYRVEQVFLIHAESGLLLNHVTAADLDAPNADLISAMLTAIQDFVHDSFRPNEGATLRTFTVGEHTVHLEAGPRALLAAVIRGTPPESLTLRLQSTLERVHLEWAQQLVDYRGETAVFEPVRPLLEECLETVLSTQRDRARGARAWLRWAVPVAAVLVVAAGLTIRARINWQRALRTLNAEPGIVVVDASRGWSGWRFNGLKDPLARDPSVVLAAAGFSPRSILGRWDSYLALDSAMVAARAGRSLAIPPTATIDVRADTLVLGGTAGVDWLAQVRKATLPIGATTIDVSAVTPTLPPALDSLRSSIERQLILFDAGSAQLSATATTQLRGVAVATRRLMDAVTAAGAAARIELFGRTDPTGADSTNRSLAQQRVDRVSRWLLSFGVPGEIVARRPIATDSPLDDSDPARRARINRSVAFKIEVNAVSSRLK
jgi:outer membrane protein OmpA-like peptidoglycan-associated protein